MTRESLEDIVKKIIEEICQNHKSLDITKPFSIVVYDPLRSRMEGLNGTRDSLKNAVRTLLSWLDKEPASIGEILIYKPKTKVIYRKTPAP